MSSSNKNITNNKIYLSIAEFDIDKGPTIRAQLPSPIPVTSSYLSALSFPNNTKNNNNKSNDGSYWLKESNNNDRGVNETDDNNDNDDQNSPSTKFSWSQFLADQMMPDGSDRNSRNTSWVFLNRPPHEENGVFSSCGIVCCVFQLSTVSKWEARACILAVLKDDNEDEEGTLCIIDPFDYVKNSPTFSLSKQSIDPYFNNTSHYQPSAPTSPTTMMSGIYKPLGKISSIEVQAIGALPGEKMNKVIQVCNRPPLKPPKQESSFFQQFFGDDNNNDQNNHNSESKKNSSSSSSKNQNHNSSQQNNSNTPRAAANIIGDHASCGIAFLSEKDLEKLVSWINFAKDRKEEKLEQEVDEEQEQTSSKTLYGNVVSVTKKMPNARRGSVNLSVCVSCSDNSHRWLYTLRPFLETVAVACCDATGADTVEEKLARIEKIAQSAYNFLSEKLYYPIVLSQQQQNDNSESMMINSLASLSKRVTLRNYNDWFKFVNQHNNTINNSSSSSSSIWYDPNNKNLSCDCTHQIIPLKYSPHSPLLILDPSSTNFVISSSSSNNEAEGEENEKEKEEETDNNKQHSPQESFNEDHNHLILTLIETVGTEGLCRILVHILLQRRCLVICRGGGGSRATEAVMALASLFEFFDDQFFAKRVIPYASVSLLDAVQNTKGVIAGTVNPIFETRFGLGVDVIIDLDCKCVKFGGVNLQNNNSSSSPSGAPSSGNNGVSVFDCFNNSTSSSSSTSNNNNNSSSTIISSMKNKNKNSSSSMSTTNNSDIARAKQDHLQQNTKPHHSSNAAVGVTLPPSSMQSAILMGAQVTETKSNLTAVCAGSIILEKWCDDFSKDLHTLLLRRHTSQNSYGAAVLSEMTSSSTSSASKSKTTVYFEPSVEDEIRLAIVREISYLLWSLTRSCAPFCEVPIRLAESRIYFLGRWLGRGVPDEINFGMQLSRVMLPLCVAASSSSLPENYSNYFNVLKDSNNNSEENNNKNQNSNNVNSLSGPEIVMDKSTLIHFHGYHLLEEELIVSFLQNSVRLTATWKAEECLRVTSFCPRTLQVLATLCGHKSSVIRLLASMLLNKFVKAHPAIQQCAASELNMFLHFIVDAAKMEFKAQLV